MKILVPAILLFFTSILIFSAATNEKIHSADEIIIYQSGNKTLLHAPSDPRYFIIESELALKLEKGLILSSVTSQGLIAKSPSTNNLVNLTLGGNIYGFSILEGENYDKGLLRRSTDGSLAFNTFNSDEIFARSCKCRKNGSSDDDCKTGGSDASGCGSSTAVDVNILGGGGGGSASCSVECKGGYFACCKRPVDFDDDGEILLQP